MRNSLRLVVALGAASMFGAALLLACSDDTSVDVNTDAGIDGAKPDAPQADTSPPDAGGDTAPPFDGGFVVDTFDTVLATELCKSLARCCYGSPMPAEGGAGDGGTFDNQKCINSLKDFGFQGSNIGTALRDAGNVTLDQLSADDCINKIKAIKCDLPGTEYTAARASCFAAYTGKLGAGTACRGSVECQNGFFCKGQVDGGTGVCTAIRPLNGPCGDNPTSLTEYEEACSYRAGGGTGNYCRWTNDPANQVELDAGEWKCVASAGMGTGCVSSTWCKDTICDPTTSLCTSPDKLFEGQCGTYLK
ncbi:MAG: hypothetical protein JWP87_5557 [Labilithrix sp.]|nr:hypothetical protein [Labilithrix sp.]